MESKLKKVGIVYIIYVIFVGIINGLFIYITYDTYNDCTSKYVNSNNFKKFFGENNKFFQFSILGFIMIILYILWILLFRCLRGICCQCWKSCFGKNESSKKAINCKIFCEGCCGNPLLLGCGFIFIGYLIYSYFPDCNNASPKLINNIFKFNDNPIKFLFLILMILISIALISFIPIYFFYVKNAISKENDELMAKNNNNNNIEINRISSHINNNNQNNWKPPPPQSPPPQHIIDKRRRSMPAQHIGNSYHNNSINNGGLLSPVVRSRAESYDPSKNVERISQDQAPVAFGGFGLNLNNNENNNNNGGSIVSGLMNRSPTRERVKSQEDSLDDLKDNNGNNNINSNDNNNDNDISIELSVSLVDDNNGNKNKTTKGAETSVSFPSLYLGFARRVSQGVLKVLDILEQDTECAICMDELEIGQEMAQLNCGHCFHKECVVDWLQNDPTCPFCRQDVKNYTKIRESQLDLLTKKT